jgi:hypothetical protein
VKLETFVRETVVNKKRRGRRERFFLSKDSTCPFHTLPFTYNGVSLLFYPERFSFFGSYFNS